MKDKKTKKPKKESKQIIEIHIYVHQTPNFSWNPPLNPITPGTNPNYPHNPVIYC